MRLKLDENLGAHHAALLRHAGHDVDTVRGEDLSGATDVAVLAAAVRTGRALVTLDLDFGDPWRFPPGPTPGIAVLRVRSRPGRQELDAVLDRLVAGLRHQDLTGRLWLVAIDRIRRYQPPADGPP